ncbi:MAG: hypothetical protein QOE23_3111, partial [Pseudonocardiales bacterium]|nr:hypothetical protein [Pseudonocardiales bacterium]
MITRSPEIAKILKAADLDVNHFLAYRTISLSRRS